MKQTRAFRQSKLRLTNMYKLILAVLISAIFLLGSTWLLLPHPNWSAQTEAPFMILSGMAGLLTLGFMLGFQGERHRMYDFLLTSWVCKWVKTMKGKG